MYVNIGMVIKHFFGHWLKRIPAKMSALVQQINLPMGGGFLPADFSKSAVADLTKSANGGGDFCLQI